MISTEEQGLTGRQQVQWSVIQQRTSPLKVRNGNPTPSHSRNAYSGVTCFKCRLIDERAVILQHNGPFAAERPCGTKSPNWRANDALGHVERRKFNLVAFFNMSLFIICSPVSRFLYHVIAQLQKANCV